MKDIKQKISLDIEAQIGGARKAMDELAKGFKGLVLPTNLNANIEKTVRDLGKQLDTLDGLSSKGYGGLEDSKKAVSSLTKVAGLLETLQGYQSQITGLPVDRLAPKETVTRLKKIASLTKNISKIEGGEGSVAKDIAREEKNLAGLEAKKQAYLDEEKRNKSLIIDLNNKIIENAKKEEEIQKNINELSKANREEMTKGQKGAHTKKLNGLNVAMEDVKKESTDAAEAIQALDDNQKKLSNTILRTQSAIEAKGNLISGFKDPEYIQKELVSIKQAFADIARVPMDKVPDTLEEMKAALDTMSSEELETIKDRLATLEDAAKGVPGAFGDINKKADELKETNKEIEEVTRSVEDFKNKVASFFSLGNTVEIFKRAIREAYKTVKELDAAMTETAVVTNFSIGDMWEELPRYTKLANELGATTLGAYETMTLYYQQGLKTNEVFAVGKETMKMARIANLDYAESTNLMTAALRGFNMEVNEINSQKINDVYSELAAITAADTYEIASSMTKTASIAHSAGMEFSTTAAFLSTMIETTREAPENIGTAMKTIIARFQELKKDPALIGEVDGEFVDANKIEAALRKVDISLRDTNGQFRNLDEVFVELSKKWDGLDKNTQRYIATTAAGSRQQSRFLAMMGNHERTMELVDAATNSAGASQRQFEKTLESLEAKLSRLSNAAKEFSMGITNDTLIKYFIDKLTDILTLLNKITGAFDNLGPLVGTFVRSFLLFGGMKIGGSVFTSVLTNFISTLNPLGMTAGTTFAASVGAGMKAGFGGVKDTVKTQMATIMALLNKEKSKELEAMAKDTTATAVNTGVTKENTAATTKGAVAESAQADANAKGAVSEIVDAEATKNNTKEELTNQNTTKKGLTLDQAKLALNKKNIAQLLFGGKVARKQAAEALIDAKGLTGATAGLTKAAASFAVPIGAVAVALVAVGVAAYAIFKTIEYHSADKKIERLNAAADKTREALVKAREEVDDLNASLDNIRSKEDAFEELTKGTREWRNEIISLNNEVLNLLNTYPDLKKMTDAYSFDENNRMILSDDAIKEYLNQQSSVVINLQAAETGQRLAASSIGMNETLAEQKGVKKDPVDAERIETKLEEFLWTVGHAPAAALAPFSMGSSMGAFKLAESRFRDPSGSDLSVPTLVDEIPASVMDSIYKELFKQPFSLDNADMDLFNQIVKEVTGDAAMADDIWEVLTKAGQDSLDELALSYRDLAAEQQTQVDALMNNIIVNNDKINDSFEAASVKNAAALLTGDFDTRLRDEMEDLYVEYAEKGQKELYKDYADLSGATYKKGKLYDTEGEKLKLTDEEIIAALAGAGVARQIESSLETWVDGVEKLTGEQKDYIKRFSSVDGTELTEADLNELKAYFGEDLTMDSKLLEQFLKGKGYDVPDFETFRASGDFDNILQARSAYDDLMAESIFGSGAFDNILQLQTSFRDLDILAGGFNEKVASFGLDENIFDRLTQDMEISTKESFLNIAEEVFAVSGEVGANEMLKSVESLTKNLSDSEALEVIAALNSLDLNDAKSIESFSDLLKEKDIPLDVNDVNNFEKTITNLVKATRNFGENIEKIIEQAQALSKIRFNIDSKEQGRQFSKENYESLVSSGSASDDDFVFNLESEDYTYLGSSMDELSRAIIENTNALLGIDALQGDILKGQIFKDMFMEKGAETPDIDSTEQLVKALTDYNNKIVAQGGENKYGEDFLKIYGDDLEKLKEAYYSAYENYQNIGANETTLSRLEMQGESTRLQSLETPEVVNQLKNPEVANTEAYSNALQALAVSAGVSEKTLTDYQKALLNGTDAEKESARVALTNAIELKRQEKQYTKTFKALQDSVAIFEDVTEGSEGFSEAINSLGESFGLDMSVADNYSFVAENLDLIKSAAEGNLDSIMALDQALAAAHGFTISANGDFSGINGEVINTTALMDDFIMKQYEAGAYEIVEEKVKQGMTYLEPTYDRRTGLINGFTRKTADANQTVQMLRPLSAPARKTATKTSGGGGGSKGGGGGSKAPAQWENPYDEYYNLSEKINESIRQRERLEKKYDQILNSRLKTGQDLYDNLEAQIGALKAQAEMQRQLQQGRLAQLNALAAETHTDKDGNQKTFAEWGAPGYAQYDAENGVVQINWEALEAIKNEEQGSAIEAYISKLEELSGQFEDTGDTIEDIEAEIEELTKVGRDEYVDIEQRIYDAIVAAEQKLIEELSETSESIKDSNDRLINSMQKAIDEERRLRNRDKSLESIQEKQRRLDLLRRDSSGANALEIRALEEEIRGEQESYTDTLIDTKINDLQEQNDLAYDQRQQQIDLLQKQLDWNTENGVYWGMTHDLLAKGFNSDGSINLESPMAEVLKNNENWAAMSDAQREIWGDELIADGKQAWVYLQGIEAATVAIADGLSIAVPTPGSAPMAPGDGGTSGGSSGGSPSGSPGGSPERVRPPRPEPPAASPPAASPPTVSSATRALKYGDSGSDVRLLQKALYELGYRNTETKHQMGLFGSGTKAEVIRFQRDSGLPPLVANGVVAGATKEKFKLKGYKTGGLADETGPAWLDGTKAKPELVLNAKDTQNFLAFNSLIDRALRQAPKEANSGVTNYEIHIEVDEIANDYDVERIAEKASRLITEQATYRNNNVIKKLR